MVGSSHQKIFFFVTAIYQAQDFEKNEQKRSNFENFDGVHFAPL